jgi:hypothetical protein
MSRLNAWLSLEMMGYYLLFDHSFEEKITHKKMNVDPLIDL